LDDVWLYDKYEFTPWENVKLWLFGDLGTWLVGIDGDLLIGIGLLFGIDDTEFGVVLEFLLFSLQTQMVLSSRHFWQVGDDGAFFIHTPLFF